MKSLKEILAVADCAPDPDSIGLHSTGPVSVGDMHGKEAGLGGARILGHTTAFLRVGAVDYVRD